MHNFYTLEVESEIRQQESQRAAAADVRAAQADSPRGNGLRFSLPQVSLRDLRALVAPRLSLDASYNVRCAPRLVEC